MAKRFNITGTCIPAKHYMADKSSSLKQAMKLVEFGEYFSINRPRQFGKTTMFFLLTTQLNKTNEYLVMKTSFEGIGDLPFENEAAFAPVFVRLLENATLPFDTDLSGWIADNGSKVNSLDTLSAFITRLVRESKKKLVLLIDEVDKSSNNQLFVSFLALLRNKFLQAQEGLDLTFHSVILAGLHDVKTLKLKLRPGEEAKYNSPWNIATDYDADLSLHPHEIVPMLEDYSQEQGVQMDIPAIAERLYYYTSGYPVLVSMLCKIMDEKMLPNKTGRTWSVQDVETAADMLIKSERSNTNFDTLIKNLENDPELYDLVFGILIRGDAIPFNIHHPQTNLGVLHGILGNGGRLRIHNRIYSEVIFNYMSVKMLVSMYGKNYDFQDTYTLPNNVLDVEKVLLKFQELMREEYSKRDRDFLERNGRLLFLAFIKPIINGKGYTFKEPEISEERRMDIAITYFNQKYVAELKIWRGPAAHEEGLSQLADYLDRQQLDEGYLVVFDHTATKSWKNEWLEVGGKKVFAVWV